LGGPSSQRQTLSTPKHKTEAKGKNTREDVFTQAADGKGKSTSRAAPLFGNFKDAFTSTTDTRAKRSRTGPEPPAPSGPKSASPTNITPRALTQVVEEASSPVSPSDEPWNDGADINTDYVMDEVVETRSTDSRAEVSFFDVWSRTSAYQMIQFLHHITSFTTHSPFEIGVECSIDPQPVLYRILNYRPDPQADLKDTYLNACAQLLRACGDSTSYEDLLNVVSSCLVRMLIFIGQIIQEATLLEDVPTATFCKTNTVSLCYLFQSQFS
jgi:hypothetical protein